MYAARSSLLAVAPGAVSERQATDRPTADLDLIEVTHHLDPRRGALGPPVGSEVILRATFSGSPLEKQKLLVHAPNGWSKETTSDVDGLVRFEPLWPGLYVVETVHFDAGRGEEDGEPFAGTRHRTTLSFEARPPHDAAQ